VVKVKGKCEEEERRKGKKRGLKSDKRKCEGVYTPSKKNHLLMEKTGGRRNGLADGIRSTT